ncbi:MAG: transglutaminase family protein, partial [Candidatus Coproplasma sp.]
KVAKYIQNSATYNLMYDAALDGEQDIVVAFLRDYKEGVCQHYASAATLLYRALGIPARCTIGYLGKTNAGEWTEVTSDRAHAWVEVYIDGMGWVNVEVTGSSSGGGGESGKTVLCIKPVDEVKVYDGTPLVAQSFDGVDSDNALLLSQLISSGYTFNVVYGGHITEVGVTDSWIKSVTVYDKNGNEVTDIEFNFTNGSLTVLEDDIALITVHPYILQKYYDGTPLTYAEDDYYVTGLPKGWRLEFSLAGIGITDAGVLLSDKLSDLAVKVYDSSGNLIDDSRYFVVLDGVELITVNKRAITITTASDTKVYDGAPLKNDECWVSAGSLAAGHMLQVEVIGSITDIGTAYNRIGNVIILDAEGNNVTKNYDVSLNLGILEIISD